jgi:hypothetical protein
MGDFGSRVIYIAGIVLAVASAVIALIVFNSIETSTRYEGGGYVRFVGAMFIGIVIWITFTLFSGVYDDLAGRIENSTGERRRFWAVLLVRIGALAGVGLAIVGFIYAWIAELGPIAKESLGLVLFLRFLAPLLAGFAVFFSILSIASRVGRAAHSR